MLVETYEIENAVTNDELTALLADGETQLLVEELNLTGQQELFNKVSEGGVATKLHPFRRMTQEEVFVYKTLLPETCSLTNYKDGPIPLEVLRLAKQVRELYQPDMAYLEVWKPKPGCVDPILVARKSNYADPVFIIARWGESLIPFVELREQAILRQCEIVEAKAKKLINEFTAVCNNPMDYVKNHLADNYQIPNIYGNV